MCKVRTPTRLAMRVVQTGCRVVQKRTNGTTISVNQCPLFKGRIFRNSGEAAANDVCVDLRDPVCLLCTLAIASVASEAAASKIYTDGGTRRLTAR